MQVHFNIASLPIFNRAVVTIGTFDGVHTGHLQIIQQLKQVAAQCNGETVIITFHPHPRSIVASDKPILLLNTLAEKIELFKEHQINHLVVVPFTENFANQSAAQYMEDFIWHLFHPHTLIIGYDHRFGKNRTGDYQLIENYAASLGFQLVEIPQHVIHHAGVSSTRIRTCLLKGDIAEANELLGYQYFFEGLVVEGNKIGRTIGYPTANLFLSSTEKLLPANGVYAVMVKLFKDGSAVEDHSFKAMMNIGIRPTVGGATTVTEVNIFDFDKDIYGYTLRVAVCAYLRAEEKFNGLEALKMQLALDKQNAMNTLKFF